MTKEIRVCSKCWGVMQEGYIYEWDVYCSGACLPISEEQFEKEYTDEGDNCWTEWETIYNN